ncbi:MAG: RidA family protein [Gammaproteobacteria bacterium]|nr:RidA family protein [Gammaproteobacteria bacterium]NNC97761.1 RidA family protein [Gammaproteobacteria bacterium]NNM13930.1 RidA family protein [Gammaproteobacteria bacterium]
MIKALSSKNLPPPHFRYSALVKAGPFYKTAGLIGTDSSNKVIAGGTEAETRQILKNLIGFMPDFDLTLDDLISANVFIADMSEFPLVNKAWEEVFSEDQRPPTRAAVGVAALPLGAAVEIEFMFYKED